MKILLVNIWLDAERGTGTAERTRQLALALVALGCSCSILTMGPSSWSEELSAHHIAVHSIGHFGRRYPVPMLNPIRIWRLIENADIVHVMGHWYLLATAVCFVARFVHVPFIACPAGELLAYDRSKTLKRMYYQFVGRRIMAWAALVIALTGPERDDLVQRFEIHPSRIVIAPNGVRSSSAVESDPSALPTSSFILFVGRLAWVKGPDFLVEAFAAISADFPEIDLVLIGPDLGMRALLETRVRELGLSQRVRFLGFIGENQRQSFYENAVLLAIPSRSEVVPLVALEAASVGTPVLLTKFCGFDEIGDIRGGLAIDVQPAAIAHGLKKMLSDRAELKRMGQRLREYVLERYSWPEIARNLLNELAKIVQR